MNLVTNPTYVELLVYCDELCICGNGCEPIGTIDSTWSRTSGGWGTSLACLVEDTKVEYCEYRKAQNQSDRTNNDYPKDWRNCITWPIPLWHIVAHCYFLPLLMFKIQISTY